MNRREFIENAALGAGMLAAGGCSSFLAGPRERVPYGDTIGDRLWMWGHHADSFASMKGDKREFYNLPFERRVDMAAACREMQIPGCFVVRWRNLPRTADLFEYMKQFRDTKRVGFSITDQAPESFDEKVRIGFELADRMPNLTSFVMDDFFSEIKKNSGEIGKLSDLRDRLHDRGMKLGVVLYADANGLRPEYREALAFCDEVTYWFWNGKNVNTVETQVMNLRAFIGSEKPVLLGQYMYDFGGKKPLSARDMECQLEQTSRLLASRTISGVIFHCTPLVDMDLEAVEVSRRWIQANRNRRYC